MSAWHLTFFTTFLLLLSCKKPETRSADEIALDDEVTKILFIGNSLTFDHDLPEMVRLIASTNGTGDSTSVFNSAYGGYSLEMHTREDFTLKAIQRDNWDWVVMQEAVTYMLFEESFQSKALPNARYLDSLALANNTATEVLLYLPNGFKNGINCEYYPGLCTHDQMMDSLRTLHLKLADILEMDLAPAGVMWKILKHQLEIDLHDEDRSHPNLHGSYLSALTIYTSIFNTPVHTDVYAPEGIDDAIKNLMIEVVNASVLGNKPNWRVY